MKYNEVRQPKVIVAANIVYTLIEPLRIVSDLPLITEGPFYTCQERPGILFRPNAEFLLGQSDTPTMFSQGV